VLDRRIQITLLSCRGEMAVPGGIMEGSFDHSLFIWI